MMIRRFCPSGVVRGWGWWVLACVSLFSHGASPRLESPVLSGDTLRFRVTGEPGQSYRVEASPNLRQWTVLQTGVAVAGTLNAEVKLDGLPHRFFRAASAEPPKPFLTVVPTVATNQTATALVRPESATTLVWEGPSGEVHTLTIPTNAVTEPLLVRMTLITRLEGLPAARGFLTGIRLEPEGRVLQVPMSWEVEFPTPLNHPRMASYGFRNRGAELHLVPDQVSAQKVRVRLVQLGSYATGEFSLEELEPIAATVPPARPTGSRLAPRATMEECYPEDEQAALELRGRLEDVLRPLQQETAYRLGIERQRQLLGVEDDSNPTYLNEILVNSARFEEYLVTEIPAASQRCATTREMLTWVLGVERQKQLLGAGDENSSANWVGLACGGFSTCQRQALECCRTRGGDTRLIAFLLGIERQRQLLGATDGSCGSLDIEQAIEECAPKWYGTLTVTEKGSYSTNRSSLSTINTHRIQHEFQLQATVASVKEEIVEPVLFLPGHTNLTFELTGPLIVSRTIQRHYEDLWDPCGGARPARAEIRPRDGGEALLDKENVTYSTNAPVTFTVSARLMAPGTGTLGLTPRLDFNTPAVMLEPSGWRERVIKAVSSTGCEVENESGPPTEAFGSGGVGVSRGSGGFTYTADTISYFRVTARTEGPLVIVQEVNLSFRRFRR